MVRIKTRIKSSPKLVSVSELLSLIPDSYIDELAASVQVDKWTKKLKGSAIFKLVLFSLLQSDRLSLRIMEDNTKDPLLQALVPAFASDEATWTGIRDRLIHIKSTFFKGLYEKVYEMAADKYGSKGLETHHIKRFDSTMIATFSHLLEGMKVGNTAKGKTQVKLTTELKDDFLIQMTFHKDQDHLSEETALKEAVKGQSTKNQEDISVFDKGLKSRKTFAEFDDAEILFVARVNEAPRYQFIKTHGLDTPKVEGEKDTELTFVQDSIVKLYEGSTKINPKDLRLIQYKLNKTGEILSFVTNVLDLKAATIAQIYKMRWDIEVLFRFMKQEMNLSHFVCNDLNAIEVMLYCTLIASMLVLIYKQKNDISSYKRAKIQFFKELIYDILLEMIDDPDAIAHLKQILLKFKRKL